MTFALGVIPVVLLLLGFPIFLVLLSAASVALVFYMQMPMAALHQNLFGSINAYALLAIPYFIYAGELMGRGTVARRLVDFVQDGVGSVRGSLGVTTVGVATIFGAISGVSAASVATIGKIMYPSMVNAGYPPSFAAGLITAVGAIDIIIPPSIPMIVYGAAAQESVPRLYAAGIAPGLLIALIIAGYVVWRAKRQNFGARKTFQRQPVYAVHGAKSLGTRAPVIILGGIYGGVFSPTEAAAVACVYAAFVTMVIFRELSGCDSHRGSRCDRAFHGANSRHRGLCGRVRLASHRQPGARNAGLVDQISGGIALAVPAGGQRSVADRRLLP